MLLTALVLLLHVLVFVYWLGGDLGAFYTSRYLTLPGIPADRRLLAAKIVGDVDMAPRTALILALPTGLVAAEIRGWLDLGLLPIGIVVAIALVWLATAWRLHIEHGSSGLLAGFDRILRWVLIISALGYAVLGLADIAPVPLFIELKLIVLALCTLMGLAIRQVLKPLGPAIAKLADPGTSADGEADLGATLKKARPLVLIIWALLLTAALLGLWTPMSF